MTNETTIDGVIVRKLWNWSAWYASGYRANIRASMDAGDGHRAREYLRWLAKVRGLLVDLDGGKMEYAYVVAARENRPRAMVWGSGENEIRLEIPNWDHVPAVAHTVYLDDGTEQKVGTLDARQAWKDAGISEERPKRRAVVTAAQLRQVMRGMLAGEAEAIAQARELLQVAA